MSKVEAAGFEGVEGSEAVDTSSTLLSFVGTPGAVGVDASSVSLLAASVFDGAEATVGVVTSSPSSLVGEVEGAEVTDGRVGIVGIPAGCRLGVVAPEPVAFPFLLRTRFFFALMTVVEGSPPAPEAPDAELCPSSSSSSFADWEGP